MENYVCPYVFISESRLKTTRIVHQPESQPSCALHIVESHGLTIDLCMPCSKNVFLPCMSATTKSDKSDSNERNPMQITPPESFFQRDMLY